MLSWVFLLASRQKALYQLEQTRCLQVEMFGLAHKSFTWHSHRNTNSSSDDLTEAAVGRERKRKRKRKRKCSEPTAFKGTSPETPGWERLYVNYNPEHNYTQEPEQVDCEAGPPTGSSEPVDHKSGLPTDWTETASWKSEFSTESFSNPMDVEPKEDSPPVLLASEDIFSYWESSGNCEAQIRQDCLLFG